MMFNAAVSLDGSGEFISIGAAVAADSKSRFYMNVKPGIYREHIEIESHKTFIALIGDNNAATTVIVDNRINGTGFGTSQNSAGPGNHQAVALLNDNTQTTYFKCLFCGIPRHTFYKWKTIVFQRL